MRIRNKMPKTNTEEQFHLHDDGTGTSLGFWKNFIPNGFGLVMSEADVGYSTLLMTREDWEQVKTKIDNLLNEKESPK